MGSGFFNEYIWVLDDDWMSKEYEKMNILVSEEEDEKERIVEWTFKTIDVWIGSAVLLFIDSLNGCIENPCLE